MLAKRVIPCLDVDQGRVVKGTNFVNLRDAGDPVEVAARYEQEGADELVFLDITASHEERDIMLDVVRRTAEQVFMPLTVGGGIRTLDDIRALAEGRQRQGVDQFGGLPESGVRARGGAAIRQPVHCGQHRSQAGASATVERCGKSTSTAAGCRPVWRRSPGPGGSKQLGAGEIVLTSMDCDGTKDGYDLEITAAVSQAVSIPVVASGGAGQPGAPGRRDPDRQGRRGVGGQHFSFWRVHDREKPNRSWPHRGIPVRL